MITPPFSELVGISINSLLINKVRTMLTSLGIIIGVTSVILFRLAENRPACWADEGDKESNFFGLRPKYCASLLRSSLFEAVILACFGGLIGILLGSAITQVINKFFPAIVTLNSVLLAFGVSSLVGVIFGVAPARRASKLSPIEALRYE